MKVLPCFAAAVIFAALNISPVLAETFLQGKLERHISLPPLLPTQRPGHALTDKFSFPFGTHEWFQVPSWAAGEWKQTNSLVICDESGSSRSTTQRNQNEEFVFDLGQQLDREGNIWHYGVHQTERPASGENQAMETTCLFTIKETAGNDYSLRLKRRTVRYMTKKVESKAVIDEVKRVESVLNLRLLDDVPETLVAEVQTREFGADGQQTRYIESLAFWRKIRGFRSQNRCGQKDLYPLLIEFFRSTGQRSLIPAPTSGGGVDE